MNNSYNTDFNNIDTDDFNLQKEFFKYLYYWKFFIISIVFCLFCAFIFLRYSPKVYNTSAKIQVIDKKETSLELPSASELLSNSKINLENKIEVLKSYPILEEVIKNINLQVSVIAIGDIKEGLQVKYPFKIALKTPIDSLADQACLLYTSPSPRD